MRHEWAPAFAALTATDAIRRSQGRAADLAGLGPRRLASRIVVTGRGFRVHAYRDAAEAPPVLLVAAPIKRAYIWDLMPQASVVRLLHDAGFAVYLLDWLDPAPSDAGLGFDDYVTSLVGGAVDAIRLESGERPLLVGHSLGGTFTAAFAAAHPEAVRGIVLLEAPLRFGGDAGAFAPLVAACPDARRLPAGPGLVPGSFLDLASITAAPVTFQLERHLDLVASLGRRSLSVHLRVQRWTLDELAMPGALFAEIVEDLYRDDRFMRSALVLGGRPVGPGSLVVPMLTVASPDSTVIPPTSIVPFHDRAASPNKKLLWYQGDRGVAIQHVGVLVGRTAHRVLWPQIIAWMRELS